MATIPTNFAPAALKKLFDRQMARALKLTNDEQSLKALFPLLGEIRGTGDKWNPAFLIIVQRIGLTLHERMANIAPDGKPGKNYLTESERLIDLDDIPPGHYLAVGVRIGLATLNTRLNQCAANFKAEGYLAGTAVEGIMAATYEPRILRYLSINLLGSRYGDNAPYLTVRDGEPELNSFWHDGGYPGYGAMSCERRLWPGERKP